LSRDRAGRAADSGACAGAFAPRPARIRPARVRHRHSLTDAALAAPKSQVKNILPGFSPPTYALFASTVRSGIHRAMSDEPGEEVAVP
jgi:hypothetical protein